MRKEDTIEKCEVCFIEKIKRRKVPKVEGLQIKHYQDRKQNGETLKKIEATEEIQPGQPDDYENEKIIDNSRQKKTK